MTPDRPCRQSPSDAAVCRPCRSRHNRPWRVNSGARRSLEAIRSLEVIPVGLERIGRKQGTALATGYAK